MGIAQVHSQAFYNSTIPWQSSQQSFSSTRNEPFYHLMKLREANAIKVKLQFNPEPPIKYHLLALLDRGGGGKPPARSVICGLPSQTSGSRKCSANHRLACRNISGAQP
jgi:hypothetical protein